MISTSVSKIRNGSMQTSHKASIEVCRINLRTCTPTERTGRKTANACQILSYRPYSRIVLMKISSTCEHSQCRLLVRRFGKVGCNSMEYLTLPDDIRSYCRYMIIMLNQYRFQAMRCGGLAERTPNSTGTTHMLVCIITD